jgi:cytidylate kinase
MSIVAISQTLGSLGDEIGRALARALSYEFADREIILNAAEQFGEGVAALEQLTEGKPSLWERFTETKRRYLAYVEAVIWELAARDNVVLVGRGATFVVRSLRHAVRVRVTAPEPLRARRLENEQGLTPDAIDLVRQSDHERASRIRFLYRAAWDDPMHYDVVLNTERLDVEACVELVAAHLRMPRFRPTPASLVEARDASATARASAALLANPATRELQLFFACQDGQLSISGRVARGEQRAAAEEVCATVPGVTRVVNEIVVLGPAPMLAPF